MNVPETPGVPRERFVASEGVTLITTEAFPEMPTISVAEFQQIVCVTPGNQSDWRFCVSEGSTGVAKLNVPPAFVEYWRIIFPGSFSLSMSWNVIVIFPLAGFAGFVGVWTIARGESIDGKLGPFTQPLERRAATQTIAANTESDLFRPVIPAYSNYWFIVIIGRGSAVVKADSAGG